jgi:putative peptide zinc metalloprotease protein
MSEPIYSPHWYRVARLKPALRAHARVTRREARGETWYIVEDGATGRHYRFNPATHALIARMDGATTVEEIWQQLNAEQPDEAPGQEEMIQLLGRLYLANILQCDLAPDAEELLRRGERETRRQRFSRFGNPLALRFRLVDPDAWLSRSLRWVRFCFTRTAAVLWVATMAVALGVAWQHGPALAAHAGERALTPGNFLMLWLIFPFIKAIHELGHAFAVKRWGGAVHEMGVMLLVMMPVPYVDASSASSFTARYQRVLVSAAGVMIEMFLAALALFVWAMAEPGTLRDAMLAVMLIGGVSTLLFNGNPLLRFDAYYALSDLIEMPNLAARANQYYLWLLRRHVFGLREKPGSDSRGERFWLLLYAPLSLAYRLAISFAIAIYLSGKYFVVGVVLAAWAVATQLLWPLWQGIRFLFRSPVLASRRPRAVALAVGFAAASVLALFGAPMPLSTYAEGVVWPPEQAQLRAAGEGFVEAVLAKDGDDVAIGTPLVRVTDPDFDNQLRIQSALARELEARDIALRETDRVKAEIARDQLHAVEAELARLREREAEQIIRSKTAGRVVLPQAEDLSGRFVKQGESVGYVLAPAKLTARVVIPQDDIALIRQGTYRVRLRVADARADVIRAYILRASGGAVQELPSRVLGSQGGGGIPVDPHDEEGRRVPQGVFVIDVEADDAGAMLKRVGTRVYVHFDHGYEPLAFRWWRSLHRQFLRQVAQ